MALTDADVEKIRRSFNKSLAERRAAESELWETKAVGPCHVCGDSVIRTPFCRPDPMPVYGPGSRRWQPDGYHYECAGCHLLYGAPPGTTGKV